MKIMLYAPFCHIAGSKEFELKVSMEVICVREMLKMLTARWNTLEKYFGDLEESRNISGRLTIIVDGERKELEDFIKSNKTVKILGPISGG